MTTPALLAALDTAALALAVLDAEAKDIGPGDRPAPGGAEPNTFGLPAGTAIRKTLVRFLRRQAARVLGRVRRDPLAVTSADLSVTDWTDAMTAAMTPVLRPIWDAGGKKLYGEVGLSPGAWEVVSPELAPLIEKQSFWLSSETNKKTSLDLAAAHQGVRDALKEGLIEKGESLDWLTERVKDVFDGAETWRARRIAATEAARAQNTASLEAARRSGVVGAKRLLVSGDACFGAGSKILKVEGGNIVPVGIETIEPGDMVIGGSGWPRRVLAFAARRHRGDVVRGPGFIATPDHRFLTHDGWRPIGEYTVEAGGRIGDLVVRKPEYVPAAFQEVSRLSFIFGGNLRHGMPVHPVTEDDQVEIVDHEIDDPSVVHGHLFPEGDAGSREGLRHRDFETGAVLLDAVIVDVGAVQGTEIAFGPLRRTYPAREFGEGFTAGCTDAGNPLLPGGIAITEHHGSMVLAGTFPGTELLVGLFPGEPSGTESTAALVARFVGELGDVRVHHPGEFHAFPAATGSRAQEASGDPEFFAADLTGDDRGFVVAKPRLAATVEAAEPLAPLDVLLMGPVGLGASFAGQDFGPVRIPCDPVAGLATVLPAAIDFLAATGEILPALGASQGDFHPGIVPSPLTIVNTFDALVYDIEIEGDHSFLLPCGLIAHNCPICHKVKASEPAGGWPLDATMYDDGQGHEFYSEAPCPPLHVHCQCSITYVISKEFSGDNGDGEEGTDG
jgi:hypothetical protein